MKVIFAQGNPGSDYTHTRHNVGWVVLDAFASALQASFVQKSKFKAYVAEVSYRGETILFVKPTTFYNETGQSIRAIKDFYQLDPKDILVLHDDIALPIGAIRSRDRGSDAGNNGIKSINSHIGQDYWRIRIGIQPDHPVSDTAAYVLGKLNAHDRDILKLLIPEIIKMCDEFIDETIAAHSVRVSLD